MSKYPRLGNNEVFTINWETQSLRFACCDCGMVHDIFLRTRRPKKIDLMFRNKSRCTAQLRRHNYGNLQRDKVRRFAMVKKVDQL